MPLSALVAGGTGLVGSHLVNYLVDSEHFGEVRVIIRKGSPFKNEHVSSVIEVDYDNLMSFKDDLKADVIFCCLGTTMKKAGSKEQFYKVDFSYPLTLAEIAKEHQSRQLNIITASGANEQSMFFYNKVKGEVENAISKLDLRSLNIFRPSLLLGKRNEQRAGEKIGILIMKIISPLMIGGLKKYRGIRAEDVAKAMYKISLDNHDNNRIIESDSIQELADA